MAKKKEVKKTEREIARRNWYRYQYSRQSGHDDYVKEAIRNEEYYLGAGLQWSEADRIKMKAERRFMAEFNHILPVVQTATGLQLHSRVDMEFRPRGEGADENTAEILTKVVRQICDNVRYHWKESYQYEDGLILRRGFLEFRMDFSNNFQGEIAVDDIDPLDVHIDPDANSYDPKTWNDVIIVRWMDDDQIEGRYGEDKLRELHQLADAYFEDDQYQDRSHFGDDADGGDSSEEWCKQDDDDDKTSRLFLVIDRQCKKLVRDEVIVYFTGEVKAKSDMSPIQIEKALEMGFETVADFERIKWTVTCGNKVLFDDWSPYRTYTLIPYFPIFRRGKTRGIVDNLRSPQDVENKAISLEIEVATKVSNAGWKVPEGSLKNMEPEDLEKYGGKNGLVMVFDPEIGEPSKIEMNHVPQGISKIADKAEFAIKTISGMSDSLQGQKGNEVSGVAIQSKQYMGQTQMGRPLDNLAYSRSLSAQKMVELIQMFFTEERVFRITDPDTGDVTDEFVANEIQEDGSILNDLTIGRYDVVITDTPTHDTYNQGQFDQMMQMREKGVMIGDAHVVRSSSLQNKHDIAKELEVSIEPPPDPVAEATAADRLAAADLKKAQTDKVKAETINERVDAQYSAVQTAGVIAAQPTAAALADMIARSAGYVDQDQAPIFPTPGMQGDYPAGTPGPLELPANTDPTSPVPVPDTASPSVGLQEGIETQRIEEI